ncbi:MAG: hypothetical protein JO257_32300 [Deltaproteobacteria bacterium]|nr:hypothetical protein [Deltaproteobacteria bacterium]
MSRALILLAILALLAMLAARAAAAAPAPAPFADDPSDLDAADGDVLDMGGEPHAPTGGRSSGAGIDAATSASDASTDASRSPGTPGGLPAGAGTLPTTRDVIAAAVRAAGLAGDPAAGWRRRARLAGLVPQLSVRAGQDETWRDVADPTLGHVIAYGVTASWRLERLVYDPSELRIATVDVLRRRERRRLAWYVISLYRAWRRTQNEDLAAQLDVVTDGWFSARVGP